MGIPLTARMPVEFTPPSLLVRNQLIAAENMRRAERGEEPSDAIKIIVRVPTMYERDSFSAALVRGGVVHYSRKQIRDLMLAAASHLHDDAEFEQLSADLQELWAAADAANACQQLRTDRYIQLMDQQKHLPKTAKRMTEEEMEAELQTIQPESVIDDLKRVRVTAMQQDLTSRYEPIQKAFADLAEQDTRRAWLCIELYVVNWHGLHATPDGNGRGGITRPEAEFLRVQIGAEAFEELADFIYAMHGIDGDEEKNLASLIENTSAPIGSTLAESMASNEAGPSTDTPTTPIPETGSPKTTDSSSSSTKRSRKKTVKSEPTQTAAV
jgi:hypothetical protein